MTPSKYGYILCTYLNARRTLMVELTGSEKQITWATDIRSAAIQAIYDRYAEVIANTEYLLEYNTAKGKTERAALFAEQLSNLLLDLDYVIKQLSNCAESDTWINRRNNTATDFIRVELVECTDGLKRMENMNRDWQNDDAASCAAGM